MTKASPQRKVDPFKTRKAKVSSAPANDALVPPPEIAQAVDSFRAAQDQYKHFEGEMTIYRDKVLDYSHGEYAKRVFKGLLKSFKIQGDESVLTYVAMDSSAGLTDDDLENFTEQWGKKAAEELIVRDYGSIRFEAATLEAHYDEIVEALQVLQPDVLENLFKPMLMKAKPGAATLAKHYAKTPDQMKSLLKSLKIKNYLR